MITKKDDGTYTVIVGGLVMNCKTLEEAIQIKKDYYDSIRDCC